MPTNELEAASPKITPVPVIDQEAFPFYRQTHQGERNPCERTPEEIVRFERIIGGSRAKSANDLAAARFSSL